MKDIICPITYIPIRKEPAHSSEQVSQLLFGESATILELKQDWAFIETHFDNYQGWIEKKVAHSIEKPSSLDILSCGTVSFILIPSSLRLS